MDSRSAVSWRIGCCLALVLASCLLVAACGGSSKKSSSSNASSAPAQATSATASAGSATSGPIKISQFKYVPPSLTVKVGTKVAIANGDPDQHTVTADGGAFDSGTLKPNGGGSVTLKSAGTFPYHCAFHPFMHGTVTVR
jgi:plastocyanin